MEQCFNNSPISIVKYGVRVHRTFRSNIDCKLHPFNEHQTCNILADYINAAMLYQSIGSSIVTPVLIKEANEPSPVHNFR